MSFLFAWAALAVVLLVVFSCLGRSAARADDAYDSEVEVLMRDATPVPLDGRAGGSRRAASRSASLGGPEPGLAARADGAR